MLTTVSDIVATWAALGLETLPFALLGAVLSAAAARWIPDGLLSRRLPGGLVGGVTTGALIGIVLPVCDCTVVPMARRLVQKGMRPSAAAAFLCAAPAVGPAVMAATWWAFPDRPGFFLMRAGAGLATAWIAGLATAGSSSGQILKLQMRGGASEGHGGECGCSACEHSVSGSGVPGFLRQVSSEFCETMSYALAGGLAASALLVLLPQGGASAASRLGGFATVPAMMGLGFSFSLCAHADAFVARSFQGLTSPGAMLAFMVFGAMLDLRNLLQLRAVFRRGFLLRLIPAMVGGTLACGWLLDLAGRP